jgi:translocation and assembly module TamB
LALAGAGVGRFRRAVGRLVATGAAALVFGGAATVGLVLHIDLAPSRRIVRTVVNQVLAGVFEGKIIADEIDHIGLDGVVIRGATVVDPRGRQVIRATTIRARTDVLAIARDALFGEGPLVIDLGDVRLEHADVLIEMGPEGKPTIEEAFTPLPSKPSTKPEAPSAPSREVRVHLPRIEIGHAWAHGLIAAPRSLDADVTRLKASVLVGNEGVTVDVQPTGLFDRTFLPAPTGGAGEYHLRVRDGGEGEDLIRMWMSFSGQVGAVEVLARGTIEDDYMSATAELPHATPEQVATVIPGLPLREPVTATVLMEGEIPRFDVSARVETHYSAKHHAKAIAEGGLDGTGPVQLRLDLHAVDLDPRIFGDLYPDARVNARGSMYALLSDGMPRIVVDAHSEATQTGGTAVPAADMHVVLDRGVLSGTTHLYEPGMPVDAKFRVTPQGELRFEASSDVPDVGAVPRLAGAIHGRAKVRVAGSLKNGELDANVDGTVGSFRAGDQFSLEQAQVRGKVRGPVEQLQVNASLTGKGARAGRYDFEEVTAQATGPLRSPRLSTVLTDGQTGYVSAEGFVDPRAGGVRDVKVKLEKDGTEVHGTVARVGPSKGGIGLEGVKLEGEGVGAVQGGLVVRGDDLTGSMKGEGLDLARVGQLLGMPYRVRGIANVDIDLERGKNGRNGHVLVELVDGEFPLLSGVSAHVAAKFKDDQLEADALVRLVAEAPAEMHATPVDPGGIRCDGTIAQVRFSKGTGVVEGPLLSPKTWADVTGRVEVAAEDWNLHCLSKLFPIGLPVSEIKGSVTTKFVVTRKPDERFPSLQDFFFRTHQLAISGPQGLHDNEPAWTSNSTDLKLTGSFDGPSGRTTATLTVYDGYVPPELTATVDLDLPTLVDQPEKRWQSLRASPVTARLSVPRRAVSDFRAWPSFVHPYIPPITGDVRIDGYVDGTVDEPFVTVRTIGWGVAHAQKAGVVEASPWALPVDVDALATYDTKQGTLDAHVTRGGREIATASAEIEADLHELLGGPRRDPNKPTWTGGVFAKLAEVPLGEIPQLADTGIGGHVGGTISIANLNDKPTMKIELLAPDLKVGDDLYFEEGTLKLEIQRGADGKDRGIATAKLVGHDQGRLDATAYSGIVWQDGMVPTIDVEAPADLHARADRFRLAALHPLVSSVLSKLDGELNGDVRLGWKRLGEGAKGALVARMEVKDGVFHVPQIGQEFKNARVRIVTPEHAPAGYGVIRFDDIRADGISGGVRGWAVARVDGLRFVDASGELYIDENNELPVTLEGVPVGNARGKVVLQAEKHDRTIDVRLAIPTLHLALPASPGKDVQQLDEHPDVEVSHALGPEKEPRAADALRWVVVFDLGRIELEGQNVDVTLRGVASAPPTVELTDKARITGDIELIEGTITLRGKEFKIERGLVRMRAEDTANPYLNVTAYWDSPDGARIYVDYVGVLKPVTNEKLRFRSNPPRSEQEILATLLFGAGFDQDPGGRAKGADASRAAGGLVAGQLGAPAAEQLNEVLSGTALHNFSTRIGATDEGAVQTSLVVEVSDSVTALYTYEQAGNASAAQGGPGGGASGQRSGRNKISIDWRFHRNWSIRGSVGYEEGQPSSGIDLLYQYRY